MAGLFILRWSVSLAWITFLCQIHGSPIDRPCTVLSAAIPNSKGDVFDEKDYVRKRWGSERFWSGGMIFLGAMLGLTLLSLLVTLSAQAQQGDRYHGIIIATKDGAQSLDGSYKFRHSSVDDVSTSSRDGVQSRGSMIFSGGNGIWIGILYRQQRRDRGLRS